MNSPIFITAGGSGGHTTPALNFGHHLKDLGYPVVFITDSRTEKFFTQEQNVITLPVMRPSLKHPWKSLITASQSLWMCLSLIKKWKPKRCLAFGGYTSAPLLTACILTRTPYDIHEQNAILGRSNRYYGLMAGRIFTSFPHTEMHHERLEKKMCYTGFPLQQDFIVKERKISKNLRSILILAGSQGSEFLSHKVAQALIQLPEVIRKNLKISHQVQEKLIPGLQLLYEQYHINAELQPFFHDVRDRMQSHDLLIGRSGASTLFEALACRIPSIFIPYPQAKDHHQEKNALFCVQGNGAEIIHQNTKDFTSELVEKISNFWYVPSKLEHMSMSMAELLPDLTGIFTMTTHFLEDTKNE